MNYTKIHFEQDSAPAKRFRTGVSLHSHTLHSKESLDFLYRRLRRLPILQNALDYVEARYRISHGKPPDIARAWWTPPLSAHQAWKLETEQIETHLKLHSLVSITDHDDIEAPIELQLLSESRSVPVSVEWTVPYGGTFFHLGVHNLAPDRARGTITALAEFTSGRSETHLCSLLKSLAADRGTLIVFNHPHWDENHIGEEEHRRLVRQFSAEYKPFIHAFELNGLRSWHENRTVFDLAKLFGKPVVAGGDRHGTEPNTVLNLTNARTFSDFVDEVRGGFSDVLVTAQYQEPLAMRTLQSVEDILGDFVHHAFGWRRWTDRTFYICDDGGVRSISEIWRDEPLPLRMMTRSLELLHNRQFKHAFRIAFARREQVAI